jgi:phosphoglycerol geranylgeranyltransferase
LRADYQNKSARQEIDSPHDGKLAAPGRILTQLLQIREQRGAGYFVLIDPDKWPAARLPEIAAAAGEQGADALLIGSSLLLNPNFDDIVRSIKNAAAIPAIIFPGSTMQISRHADAILFLSLVSGRNPSYLIGEQVLAAPVIKHLGIEPIATAYMLIESGRSTSAEFMSATRPIPRDKNDIAQATALAAQYLGFRLIYLEAGSGAENPVATEMIAAVSGFVDLPIIVGGGLRRPELAAAAVAAGASFIVTGNVLEKDGHSQLIREFAEAIHQR